VSASHADIKTTATPKGTVYYISLNHEEPGNLAKPEVREAFKWLVDYSARSATRIIKNIGVVHQNFLPVGLLGASTVNPYKLDVDKAKASTGQGRIARTASRSRSICAPSSRCRALPRPSSKPPSAPGSTIEIMPWRWQADVLTKYRARTHDMYIGQWGADYWDPHTNADTFVRNPDNADNAKSKPLAWRNAWDIPELTKQADAAVLERDPAKRKAMYEKMQAEFRKPPAHLSMLYQQTEVAAYRTHVDGLKHRLDVGLHLRVIASPSANA
jgi:peptide/nickel transport system substrate-binding protein